MDKIRYNTFNNLTYCILPPAADSVLGFYDRVTKTFFEPVGTIGSFIAGSDI